MVPDKSAFKTFLLTNNRSKPILLLKVYRKGQVVYYGNITRDIGSANFTDTADNRRNAWLGDSQKN
jgi:hypothetical protein